MELADEIKANPESGARRLIAEHGDRLFAVALWLCGCEADAMRLVVESTWGGGPAHVFALDAL